MIRPAAGAAIASLIAGLASAAPARADTSYRGQVMITDGISDALIATSALRGFTDATHAGFTYLGLAGYAFGPPIVHMVHDDWGTAGLSLGTRIALPGIIGLGAHGACMRWGGKHDRLGDFLPCFGAAAVGILVGMAGAQLIDWTVLDHTDQPKVILLRFGGGF